MILLRDLDYPALVVDNLESINLISRCTRTKTGGCRSQSSSSYTKTEKKGQDTVHNVHIVNSQSHGQ